MSYLNRTNNYGARKRYAPDKDRHMQVGRAKAHSILNEPWWSDCPVCPIHLGFKMHATHGRALTWALEHVEEHRKSDVIHALKSARESGANE